MWPHSATSATGQNSLTVYRVVVRIPLRNRFRGRTFKSKSAGKKVLMMKNPGLIRLAAVALAWMFLPPALAQAPTAELSGTIRDSTGAVVTGARITVINEDTGIKSSA